MPIGLYLSKKRDKMYCLNTTIKRAIKIYYYCNFDIFLKIGFFFPSFAKETAKKYNQPIGKRREKKIWQRQMPKRD